MRKASQLYILAVIMFLLSLVEGVSGFVLWLVLPRGGGSHGGGGVERSFIWTRDTWLDLHDWFAVALVVVVLIHIILHWKWIVHMTRTCCRKPGARV